MGLYLFSPGDVLTAAEMNAIQDSLPGVLLGKSFYAPGTQQTYAYASNTWVYPDTTNLAADFVAPASGAIWVDAWGGLIQNNGAAQTAVGIGTAGSGVPDVSMNLGFIGNATTESADGTPYEFHGFLQGLTPGTTYYVYLAIYASGTNGNLYVGGASALNGGPLGIRVTAV